MEELVFDSWGLLAWLKNELPAADRVARIFAASERRELLLAINIVNLGEVLNVATRLRGWDFAQAAVASFRAKIQVVSADDDLVMRAAAIKARQRISYADAFAVATALDRRVPLVTGDPELRALAGTLPALRLEWLAAG